jgi:spoIIIJ-associated protein
MTEEPTRSVEKTARTVEEAVAAALAELGVGREQVEVEVLGEEARSFLGIFGQPQARVRVTVVETVGARARALVESIVRTMRIPATVAVTAEDEETVSLEVSGSSDLGILIGKHGQTLGALQHLAGLISNKRQTPRKRVLVDAEGYRERREKALVNLGLASARKAKQTGRDVVLGALAAHERRIIHTALHDDEGVTTKSIGEEPHRKVVVSPVRRRRGHPPPEDDSER